jgi:hypothetical protein
MEWEQLDPAVQRGQPAFQGLIGATSGVAHLLHSFKRAALVRAALARNMRKLRLAHWNGAPP